MTVLHTFSTCTPPKSSQKLPSRARWNGIYIIENFYNIEKTTQVFVYKVRGFIKELPSNRKNWRLEKLGDSGTKPVISCGNICSNILCVKTRRLHESPGLVDTHFVRLCNRTLTFVFSGETSGNYACIYMSFNIKRHINT